MKEPKLTKSLFVEFVTNPHIARRHCHDKNGVYQKIQEKLYGDMDGIAVGRAVEDQVCSLFHGQHIINVETMQRTHPDRYLGYHHNTLDALKENPDVIYQAGVCVDSLFCKSDFLVKNEEGTYDLWEVKSKNAVRKKSKTRIGDLLPELQADMSFQHVVLQKALKEKYSGRAFIVYVNKEYVRQGDIDPEALLKREEVTKELKKEEAVMNIIASMTERLKLTRDEFVKCYPYEEGCCTEKKIENLVHFGEEAPYNSIRHIPGIRKEKYQLYTLGKTLIEHFTEDERRMLYTDNGEETKASEYVSLRQKGEKVINMDGIKKKLECCTFPLFFYDYETMSRPVPLMEGTSPWQQVVVQYSVHRMDADGTISHKEAIIGPGITTNATVVDQLVQDLEQGNGTYVVWRKGFENVRNDEMGRMYPQHADVFAKINECTFDLMEIFSEQLYFHRGFQGSSSIKKVLPVLTDITYDGLAVSHGAIAADLLAGIVQGKYELNLCNQHITNLLEYCKQDTWAMVCIYQKVLEEIKE